MSETRSFSFFKAFVIGMNTIIWSVILVASIYFNKAQPQKLTVLDAHYAKNIRDTWVMDYVTTSLWLFILAAALCLFSLIVNFAFLGDHKHKISKGFVLGLFVSLTASALYIFNL